MMSAGLASTFCVFVVVVTTAAALQGDPSTTLVANGDNVARTLLNLDRLYTKRYQEYDLPSGKVFFTSPDRRLDGQQKAGEELSRLKQAYKILMLQDLENKYGPINRPRWGKRSKNPGDLPWTVRDEQFELPYGFCLYYPGDETCCTARTFRRASVEHGTREEVKDSTQVLYFGQSNFQVQSSTAVIWLGQGKSNLTQFF